MDLMEVSVIKLGDVLASAVSCGDNGVCQNSKVWMRRGLLRAKTVDAATRIRSQPLS